MKRKFSSWQIIGGLLLLVAMISLACNFSADVPDLSGFSPTFTSQAPAQPLPTLKLVTPEAGSDFGAPTLTAPDGTGTPATPGQVPPTGGQLPSSPAGAPPSSLPEVYTGANPGTVSILVGVNSGGQQGGGAGSGFVLTPDGYIATNFHVVGEASTIVVRFFNDVDARAEMVGGDPDSDLAIVKVERLPDGVHPLPLGDSNKVQVGESVVAIGNPFGIGTSMSYGIVSAVGRTIPSISQQYNIPMAIQTDAAINPGNSGGPLINMRGEVIGVNAQIRTSGGSEGNIGIGFAVPVNILKQIYPTLIQNGEYTWPYLGVGSPQNNPLAVTLDDPQTTKGALIAEVIQGGPAARAGLQQGDVVTAADGQKITSFDTLLAYIMTRRPGDQIKLRILRGSQQGEVTVTLGERPHNTGDNQ